MSKGSATVTTAAELASALADGAREIEVQGEITGSPMITLPPGTTMRGGSLHFSAKGVRLTSDNTLEDVTIVVPDQETAILNDTSVEDLGTVTLRRVTTRGQIAILAEDRLRAGHVQAEDVRVLAADVRGRYHRPHGFGVDALQGAFTLWNRQPDPAARLTAELLDISAGTAEEPVRGSGVFVGGHGDWNGKADGGTLTMIQLRTGEIHSDGGIPEGTPDLISGGVFVISGATVEELVSAGPVTTYGQNDMVLDNWGTVGTWAATAAVTSHGPSGIGFVNFGDIDTLDVQAPIVTTGKGARGFNLYDGSLRDARFESIATTGDGSMGIQISKPLGSLTVTGDVTTTGGEGLSLVKGVQITLQAVALSVKQGGSVDSLQIGGRLATAGSNVTTLEVEGQVNHCSIAGGVVATGEGSDAAHVASGGRIDLDGVQLTAEHGETLLRS
ncbi:hypothetical protein [Kribbia dieselivorans]|uniref:hypothetical protein n=1 Tax=Kribbia dieselivorans TaxID=331526 RepID=UPI00083991D2|nr:hypothetical protein [Kribbia dieselivorans]